MRALELAVALVGVLLVQLGLVRFAPGVAAGFDLFLVFVLLAALRLPLLAAAVLGSVAGLVADGFSGQLFGLQGFADTAVATLVAVAAQVFLLRDRVLVLVGMVGSAVQQGLLIGLALLFVAQPDLPSQRAILVRVLSTGLLLWVAAVLSSWRPRRTSSRARALR